MKLASKYDVKINVKIKLADIRVLIVDCAKV